MTQLSAPLVAFYLSGYTGCVKNLSQVLFLGSFFFSLVIEGTGIMQSHLVASYFLLFLPLILFLATLLGKEKIFVPRNIALIYGAFLCLTFFSVLFSVNMQRSFEYSLILLSCYFFFLYAYNHKNLEGLFVKLLIAAGFIFSLFSMAFRIFGLQNSPLFSLIDGSQFVYPLFGSHNHLGDFLLLPILILLFEIIKNKSKIRLPLFLCLLFFFTFFIFSYSKSAYLDLIVVSGGMLLYLRQQGSISFSRRILPLVLFMLVVTGSFFLITLKTTGQVPFLSTLRFFAQGRQTLSVRSLDSGRVDFLSQGVQSISEHPFIGIGPNNFLYASMRHVDLSYWTFTSHNIFIDTAVEQGIIAALLLLIFFGFIVLKSKKTLSYFLFLAILLNFQTDYTFLIASFFVLLFVLAGFVYEEKRHVSASFLLPVALLLFLATQIMFFSLIELSEGEYKSALTMYPLQSEAYQPLIDQYLAQGNEKEAAKYLGTYVQYFSGDPTALAYAGRFYQKREDLKKAESYFIRSYDAYSFGDLGTLEALYQIMIFNDGEKQAHTFVESFFKKTVEVEKVGGLPPSYRVELSKFCQQVYTPHCPYSFSL